MQKKLFKTEYCKKKNVVKIVRKQKKKKRLKEKDKYL